MRILVFGGKGDLGMALGDAGRPRGHEVLCLGREAADITIPADPVRAIQTWPCDVVVQCAAYHRVDEAELKPWLAYAVNGAGTANVAVAARVAGVRLVYISTDYVFAGDKGAPYLEPDVPNPVNVYGRSKLAGEYATIGAGAGNLIVRTAGLFGGNGQSSKGGDFIRRILARANAGETLQVVDDITTSVGFVPDVALSVIRLIEDEVVGTRHVANPGVAIWADVAELALKAAGASCELTRVKATVALKPEAGRRPEYSVLGSVYPWPTGVALPFWTQRVVEYAQAVWQAWHEPEPAAIG